jgi:hypothetical protein
MGPRGLVASVVEQALVEGAFADFAGEQAPTDTVLAGYPDPGTLAGRKAITVREL